MTVINRKIRVILSSIISTWLICTPAWADDTEIYFGGSTNITVKPNVLFVLDTSGSMTSTDGGSTTRLDRMKSALTGILNTAQDINVGLMRFSNPGGPILYPVTDIDEALVTTVQADALNGSTSASIEEGNDDAEMASDGEMNLTSSTLDMTTVQSSSNSSLSLRISASSDDAEQRSDNSMYLTSGDLELMVDGGVQRIGLRFNNVNVPKNAVITNAWLEFEIDEQNSASADPVTLLISGEDTNNAVTFSSSSNDIGSRTKTSANSSWAITTNPAVDSSLSSPSINSSVQEIVNRAGWSANNSMAFVLEYVTGSGIRWLETYDGESANAPQLHITFTTGTPTTISVQISGANNDAEEDIDDGDMHLDSSDLELMKDKDSNVIQKVGLRFSSVSIPAGVTIADARLEFEIDEEQSESSDPVTIRISAEAANSPGEFTSSNANISGRIKTAANITWTITETPAKNNPLITPNLNSLIQEVIDRGGWSNNNSMVFIIEYVSGSGIRWVESEKDEGGNAAAELHVTYTAGATISNTQTVGLRFNNINIPQGATITAATLDFTAANSDSGSTNLVFYGDDSDQSNPFTSTTNDLGPVSRPRTTANVGWNAAGTLASWTEGTEYQTPDLTSIIQEIINRSGWCGGNSLAFLATGTGLRIAKSYENDPSQAVQLDISYDPASNPSGCMNHEFSIRVNSSSDDAEQSSGSVNLTSTDLELVTDASAQTIGIRFNNVQLNQGSTIASAFLEFAVDETTATEATNLTIKAENSANAATFTTASNNISGRTTTTASANWAISEQWSAEHTLKRSVDIAALVNEVLSRADWIAGNSMAFIISGTGKRVAESYDGSNLAPRLIYYTNPGNVPTTSNTVRSKLIEEVNNLEHKSGTPIVDNLYEAALYYRGDAVDYGKTRGSGSSSRADTRVSHPDSYTGGTLFQPDGCNNENLGSSACADEEITGTPMYTSPITQSCQSNHIVLLTDGQASVNTSAAKVRTLTGDASCIDSGSEACGSELVSYLKNSDQHSLVNNQTITTHTIGFNFSDQWLRDLASTGGGGFYEAESASELTSAFDTIIKTIKAVNTTFVQPSVTINQFNRFAHRDDVYFSLFKPQETAKWYGNLKKYQLKGSPATLYDDSTPQQPAIDPLTGFFGINSQSFWSTDEDGNQVEKGGAASRIPATRKIYSNVSSSAVLSVAENVFNESNTLITKDSTRLDIAGKSDLYRTDLLQWARGLDANGAQRFELGDPLHSRPELVTYDGLSNTLESSIFFGTNEGFLHAVDINTGIEQFSFIPKELLKNLDTYFINASTGARPYGMDGGITLWTKDANKDGDLKDTGDFAYLYIGMRRGGRNYYALDVTDINNPRLMWQINGGPDGSPGFEALGQTWSRPVKSKVVFNNVKYDVLIFGGGYDANQDAVTVRTADSMGNAVYIVDALTGAKIWSAGIGTGYNETHTDMVYGIPSDIRVIDMNQDGIADQLYFGDMGGQIWRYDIYNTDKDNQLNQSVDITKIADLGGSDAASNRRFYYPPDLALAVDGKKRYLSLAIGSGFRAHPLNIAIEDRFYMIKLFDTHAKPVSWTTVTEASLYDATANDIGGSDASLKAAAEVALSNTDINRKQGWYLRMTNSGEKVLSGSTTIQNQIVFTSYQPKTAPTGSCNPTQGTSRAYLVSLFDAAPTEDINEDGTLTAPDRVIQLQIGSIPATPTVIDTLESKPTVWVGPERLDQVNTDVESSRTYWIEETN